jgi:hypothetical protein
MPAKPVDLAVVRRLALKLPNVEDATSARGTGFTVAGRLLACEAIHKSAEPNSLMVRVSLDERARLIAHDPSAYYVTKHYLPYPAVLARLSRMSRSTLRDLLATSWLFVSEKAAGGKAKPVETRRARAKLRGKRPHRS